MAAPTPTTDAVPSAVGYSCATKVFSTLLSVSITGAVTNSSLTGNLNVGVGDKFKLSFLIDPKQLKRFDKNSNFYVTDNVAPYSVCNEDFSLTFSSGLHAHADAPPPTEDGTPGAIYFSLMSQRPVNDGAWLSTDLSDGKAGVPLVLMGSMGGPSPGVASTFGLTADLSYTRGTIPSLNSGVTEPHTGLTGPTSDPMDMIGTYPASALLKKTTFTIWRDWVANVVLQAQVSELKISKPTTKH